MQFEIDPLVNQDKMIRSRVQVSALSSAEAPNKDFSNGYTKNVFVRSKISAAAGSGMQLSYASAIPR
jgi:hypothetical protein